MDYRKISELYTEKVKEYLEKGFTIHLQTMRGSGECGSERGKLYSSYSVMSYINLVKGDELFMVAIVDRSFEDEDDIYRRTRNIEVFKAPSKLIKCKDGFWIGECELIERTEFHEIAENWFGTKEQADARVAKHMERVAAARPASRNEEIIYPDNARRIILPLVKRQRGFKRCTLENIEQVRRVVSYTWRGRRDTSTVYAVISIDGKQKYLPLYRHAY